MNKTKKENMMLKSIEKLMLPPKGMDLDFSQPKGAESFVPLGGISWEIFANPISLYIGGITAVLLELAEPSVGSGVWDHSNFKQDTSGRLQRTGYAAMMTIYAPKADTERMIARVVKMHTAVKGKNFNGEDYYANDPRLLNWVQATATFGFTEAYSAYVRPLSKAEKGQAFLEAQETGALYGCTAVPKSWQEWETLLNNTVTTLEGSDIVAEFVEVMATADILPPPLKPLQKIMIKAAVEISHPRIKALPQLQGYRLNLAEKVLLKTVANAMKRFPLKGLPPEQARKRLRS